MRIDNFKLKYDIEFVVCCVVYFFFGLVVRDYLVFFGGYD